VQELVKALRKRLTGVLAAMGLPPSNSCRIMVTKVAKEKALPFEPLIPNKETIAAMKEARKRKT